MLSIDMLSFITMNKSGWRNHSYAAACSVSDKVLWQCLRDQPYIKQIFLCFDSDEADRRETPKEEHKT